MEESSNARAAAFGGSASTSEEKKFADEKKKAKAEKKALKCLKDRLDDATADRMQLKPFVGRK